MPKYFDLCKNGVFHTSLKQRWRFSGFYSQLMIHSKSGMISSQMKGECGTHRGNNLCGITWPSLRKAEPQILTTLHYDFLWSPFTWFFLGASYYFRTRWMEFGSHFRGRQVETRTQIFAFCRPMWLQLLITNGSVKKC